MVVINNKTISKLYNIFINEEIYKDKIECFTREILYYLSLSDKEFATLGSQKRLWSISKNFKCRFYSKFRTNDIVEDKSLINSLVKLRQLHLSFEEGQVCPDAMHEIFMEVSSKMCAEEEHSRCQWSVLAVLSVLSYKMMIFVSSVKHAENLSRMLVGMPNNDNNIYFMSLCRDVLLSAVGQAKNAHDHATRYFFFRFLARNANGINANFNKFCERIDPTW